MEVNILTAIGVTGTISGIILGYLGYRIGLKKDYYEQGSEATGIRKDIEYIIVAIDRVSKELTTLTICVNGLIERVIRVEESAKSAHKRIDEHIKAISGERREHPRKDVSEGM